MRILIVGPDMFGLGGVANYYSHIYPLLSRDGIETDYLAIGRAHSAVRFFHPVADQFRFTKALEQYRPDLVHINPSLDLKSVIRDGMFCYQASRRGYPVLVFFRGWDEKLAEKIKGVWRKLFLKTFGRAVSFIVLADKFRERLEGWGISCPVHLATTAVPDYLQVDFDIQSKLARAVADETTKVLYLGRLEREKGVLETVRAVVQLAEEGLNITLTVAGDGAVMPEIRSIRDSSKVAGRCINIAGYVRGDEKAKVFESHHIYCFPSVYREGMPNALLEAMMFGMPVITCPTAGIADFFEDGRMGALLTGLSVDRIAESIRKIHEHRESMQEIGSYNHQYAVKNFMASNVADRLCDVYTETFRVV
jgi:glycosyltransferase involved in cell wall biosynthesis